jgi:1-aminocyclopropane-1-carboxylate deaminase/D-cysteine desulfhydrase-like pyridoxal-dependent ACC family enzyme
MCTSKPAWMGPDYAVPTEDADAAILWAARTGGWVLDRVYSGKGFGALLGMARAGRWTAGDDGGVRAYRGVCRQCSVITVPRYRDAMSLSSETASQSILDVDLLAYERGSASLRRRR